METHRPLCEFEPNLVHKRNLWSLFALIAVSGMLSWPARSQDCVQCATPAVPKETASASEWVWTKHVNEVNVLFVAARKGKLIRDLSQNDISVRDDDKPPAAIVGFRTELELPLRVGMVIDTSSSVTTRFQFEQAAASIFLRQTVKPDRDLGFVSGFSDHPTLTQDFVADRDLLSQGVERLVIGGGTALYDAVRDGCHKLKQRPEQGTVARVLVVLSDGQNNAGKLHLSDAIESAQQAEVSVYAISTNYPHQLFQGHDLAASEGDTNLRQLAEQTGGRVLFPLGPRDVAKAFAKIGEELRGRYAISYRPADFTPDGRYRKIKIQARKDGKKIKIRARKGYYARVASWSGSDWEEGDGQATASAR
jgi:Ca-activated chloride channel family protein